MYTKAHTKIYNARHSREIKKLKDEMIRSQELEIVTTFTQKCIRVKLVFFGWSEK